MNFKYIYCNQLCDALMRKKSNNQQKTSQPSVYPSINELLNHLPAFKQTENQYLKKTMLSASIALITLYGGSVEAYITKALMFRANDPKAYADQITRDVFTQIFPQNYHPEFNQYVSVNASLLIDRFEDLSQRIPRLSDALPAIRQNPDNFLTHEIDAVVYVHSAMIREKWIEIKLFTCPEQSSKILEKHLEPRNMTEYFGKNDFLGLMGFSVIHTSKNEPLAFEQERQQIAPNAPGSWMIHLFLLDQGACHDLRSARDRAEWLLNQIRSDLGDFTERIGLNKQNCFFSMTENFVKVVKMAQLLEEYKAELVKERRKTEQERKEKEQERQKREKLEQEISELKRKLAELQQKK